LYTSLSTGTHTFSVRATDPAGNVDPSPPLATWTVDPTVPVTLTAPADGTMTNDNTPTFSGAANAANGPVSLEIDDSNGNPVEILSASAGATWSATASPVLLDGSYTAFASQLGSDGVTTDYSNVIGFTVDTTPPAVTLTLSPRGTINNRTPSFGGAAGTASGDLGTVTAEIYSGSSASGTPVQTLSATPSGGSWSATAASLADGTYTVRAYQSDGAGNTGYSLTRTFAIDATPPTTTITSGPAASTTATNAAFSFTSSKPGSTFDCQLDGGVWNACSSPQSYGSLAVGAHTFSVRATDSVGNVDQTPPSQSWTITSSGPSGNPTPPGTATPPARPGPSIQPTSGGPPTVPSQPHAAALQLILRAIGTQHLRRRGTAHLVLSARCSSSCTLLLTGVIASTSRGRHGHRVNSRTMRLPRMRGTKLFAGKLVTLRITLSARSRKALVKALAQKRRLTLTLSGLATVPGTKSATGRVTIRLVL
jgi:Bacterial Ig-like domain